MKRFAVWSLALLSLAALLWASGIAPAAYNTIEQSAVALARETILNFTGSGVNCVDNPGSTRTDCTINGTGVANFAQGFTTQTSITITHNLGTTSVLVQCVDGGSPPNVIVPQNIAITSANVVTVTFSVAQTGTCVVNGAAAGTATSVPFSGITTASNTTATMTVGTGGSIVRAGTGIVDANQLLSVPFCNGYTPLNTQFVEYTTGGAPNPCYSAAAAPSPTALTLNIATKTTTYTFLGTDYAIVGDTTGGGFTVNLEAAPTTGQIHVIKKAVAANTLTLGGNGKNIDGAANVAITTQYVSYTVQYDGTQWWIE